MDSLLQAVEKGDANGVAHLLDSGLDPNSTDPQGNTILMMAARLGHLELASLLVSRKASVLRETASGDTALKMASLGGHLDMVKLLVGAGAPVENRPGWQPLHYAAFSGSTDVLGYLLQHGADKNALAPNDYTPLMLAIRNGHVEAAKALLRANVNLTHRGPAGETAISLALRRDHRELVDLLRRAGATQ